MMENDSIKQGIIDLANKVCEESFMDYPDYDKDNPIDNLPDALTVLVMEASPHDTKLLSSEVYDYFVEIIDEPKK